MHDRVAVKHPAKSGTPEQNSVEHQAIWVTTVSKAYIHISLGFTWAELSLIEFTWIQQSYLCFFVTLHISDIYVNPASRSLTNSSSLGLLELQYINPPRDFISIKSQKWALYLNSHKGALYNGSASRPLHSHPFSSSLPQNPAFSTVTFWLYFMTISKAGLTYTSLCLAHCPSLSVSFAVSIL